MQDELAFLAPWSALPAAPSGLGDLVEHSRDSDVARSSRRSKRSCCRPSSAGGMRIRRPRTAHGSMSWAAPSSRRAIAPRERMAEIERLVRQCDELARMEYDFLYDRARHLLAIGYNVDERRQDSSYYDLLASEARFSSFVAIAQGELPQENWFALGRLLTTAGGQSVLLSWSGSMFEYLMPLLVMPTYDNTLLDQSYRVAVDAADRVRETARRAVGHLGMRLQLGRCEPELPVPRLRRPRPGLEARACGGSCRRSLRVGAGADGGTRGVVPQSAAACRRRARRKVRPLRGNRLHALRACRAGKAAPSYVRSWRITRA